MENNYPLSSTLWISSRTANPKNVYSATVTSEEATVVETVCVNSSNKSFRCLQSELHTVFVTQLAN